MTRFIFRIDDTQTRTHTLTIEADTEDYARAIADMWADGDDGERETWYRNTNSIKDWDVNDWEYPPSDVSFVDEEPWNAWYRREAVGLNADERE